MQNPLGRYRDTIFFASGFAGLIYESIWTHYLRLFLGHAAYAQTLVLAIFMGGMAIGAALTARYTTRITSPLRTYALVEATIGVLALLFHPLFTATTGGFYDVAFTAHWDGAAFTAIKWGLGVLLILPQSILLGATFPLFASADTRSAPAREGRSIATLYFANSIGGAVGVLISGFVLIPSIGLFGTIATAGVVNFVIASVVIALSRPGRKLVALAQPLDAAVKSASPAKPRGKEAAGKRSRKTPVPAKAIEPVTVTSPPREVATRILLAVSFLTGASSFIYEIGWIRMLSLVLGSATHSFELMLSSFVLGLALGGLWIRKRIDTAANPGVFLGYIQIAMGAAALATVPLHNLSFNIVAEILGILPRTDGGYVLFNVMRYGIASLIMFPAAFFAGMTLPLATRLLYSTAGQGERAIGVVYSANTVGAIVGLAFAVNIGLPLIGLRYLVAFGAVIDVVLGALLLAVFGADTKRKHAYAAVLSSIAATYIVAQTFDPQKLASSVYRSGRAQTSGTVLDVADGKTATISVEKDGDRMLIKTNGKTDATANVNPAGHFAADEPTMALIGALPLLIHDAPRRVANIGFGSGLTSKMILADPRVLHLDTIEIEPKMVELARHFDPLNRSVYTDSRSAIRIEDAKSFFAANGQTYDLIVSEPSNPWVSGVSSLFSVEFYRHVSRYLNKDGLFAQWLQIYETHPDRVMSVLKAMSSAFDDYIVIAMDDGDLLLVGKPHGKVAMPPLAYAKLAPPMKTQLRNVEIANQSDITLRIVGNKALFQPWLDQHSMPGNSDFVPYLDSNADRDRFFSQGWTGMVEIALSPVPIAEILGARPPLPTPSALSIAAHFGQELPWAAARMVREIFFGPWQTPDVLAIPSGLPPSFAGQGASILDGCAQPPPRDPVFAVARLLMRVLPYLSPEEGRDVVGAVRNYECISILSGSQVRWRLLLDAVAARDADAFGAMADEMLTAGEGTAVVRARYLLAMAMLGRIHAGKMDRARTLWVQFSPRALAEQPADLVLQLLYAHAVAPGTQQ